MNSEEFIRDFQWRFKAKFGPGAKVCIIDLGPEPGKMYSLNANSQRTGFIFETHTYLSLLIRMKELLSIDKRMTADALIMDGGFYYE